MRKDVLQILHRRIRQINLLSHRNNHRASLSGGGASPLPPDKTASRYRHSMLWNIKDEKEITELQCQGLPPTLGRDMHSLGRSWGAVIPMSVPGSEIMANNNTEIKEAYVVDTRGIPSRQWLLDCEII